MLSLLIELQRLKRLDRTGWILRGLPNGTESVAAHSFGVSVTAMLLGDEMKSRGITIDVERVLRMSLLHDWTETRIGDLPRTATHYFGSETRKAAESAAFADLVAEVSAKTTLSDLHVDYEKRESLEARVVKAADIIDLLVQALALERAGARGLDEFWEVATDADFQLPGEARAVVDHVLQLLLAERSRVKGTTH
jgi:putative hydrolase of HD superfamily